MWLMYTMEYHLAMRKNEILPLAATWMELEGMILSEISRSQKAAYVFPHVWNLRNLKENHGGGKGKNNFKQREANHKTLKYREQTEGFWEWGRKGEMGDGH